MERIVLAFRNELSDRPMDEPTLIIENFFISNAVSLQLENKRLTLFIKIFRFLHKKNLFRVDVVFSVFCFFFTELSF